MIVKDWIESVINEYDEISNTTRSARKLQGNELVVQDDKQEKENPDGEGNGWGVYAMGAIMVVGGSYLAYKYFNAPK